MALSSGLDTHLDHSLDDSMGPWACFPKVHPTKTISVLCPFNLSSDLNLNSEEVLAKLQDWKLFLEEQNLSFEFLMLPFGGDSQSFLKKYPEIQSFFDHHSTFIFKESTSLFFRSEALRECFLLSEGKILISVDFEQPCDLKFFRSAILHVSRGYDFVRGNRRIEGARFRTPVSLLPHAYKRDSMSRLYNRVLKMFLDLDPKDVFSTNYVFNRDFAFEMFSLHHLRDMSFELEVALMIKLRELRSLDLPLRFFLDKEKSSKRILRESLFILRDFLIVFYRNFRGYYDPFILNHAVTADDWGLSPGVNRGIFDLAQQGVVKRVSLMATEDFLEEGLDQLKVLPGVELGLHFNLTHGVNQGFGHRGPLAFLIYWIFNRSKIKDKLRFELEKQIKRLNEVGVRPVYLDSHHHMHLAPGLLDDVADLIQKYQLKNVRYPYDSTLLFTPKVIINLLCLWARNSFDRMNLLWRKCFYPLKKDFLDQARLRSRLSRTEGYEVIVHPADSDDVSLLKFKDNYSADRVKEYRALRMLKPQSFKDRNLNRN